MTNSLQTDGSINDLETIIAENDEMINHLLAYFPTDEDREQIIVAVKQKTGFEIDNNFFTGEPASTGDLVGKYLDS